MPIPEKTKVKINLVGFFVLAIGLLYAMATQVLSVLEDRYSVRAIFPDAGGVFTNQEVTYRGITVGQVGDMEVIEEGVSIELLIREGVDIPKENIEARVMFKSAVGEQFVDLLPASNGAPFLEHGDEIPIEQTSIPVSTQELLATLEAVLRGVPPEDLKGAVDALGIGLTGRGPDLATIIESTAELGELFAERSPETIGLLKRGTKVGRAFLDSSEDFETAIRELVTVSETLAGSTDDLGRLLRGTNLTSDEVIQLLNEYDPALNRVIIELAEINELQAEHSDDLHRLLHNLPTALGKINRAFEPDTGLVRFGLVQDDNNHACSYGTARTAPSDRETGRPPKRARCAGGPGAEASAPAGEGPAATLDPGVPGALLPGVDASELVGIEEIRLPARMHDWSWSLFYLNVL